MSVSISPKHTLEQWPAIAGMSGGLLRSFIPGAIKSRLIDSEKEYFDTVEPASSELIDAFIEWSGAPAERYSTHLPPLFFAHYGMNMVARLTSLVPYNMLSVLNQGCRLQINSLIPRDSKIHLRGTLVDCSKDGNRVRIHTRVVVGTEQTPEAMVVDTFAAVMLGKSAKSAGERKTPNFKTVGTWSADEHEGQRFFYLTGDFNPIHTFWPMAKRSRFGGCILHGFASYARTYETLRNAGYNVSDIDLKFVKPNLLPNYNLAVQVARKYAGTTPVQLIGQDGERAGQVYLAGHFS